jgi:NADPH:quinone reductase-like Zn-dependent oxidoreductase
VAFADEVIRRRTPPGAARFEPTGRTPTMEAVVTTAAGGLDRLAFRQVPRPGAAQGELLVQVLAAGVNATDLNTRLGWYASTVTADTTSAAAIAEHDGAGDGDEGWRAETPFPLIQGADCCGRVVAVGAGGDQRVVGQRVLVRPCMRPAGFGSMETIWMGSDFDGAFAQYVSVPATEVFAVDCAWSDADLGSVPCAYGTAENMLRRAAVIAGEHVLVSGASGGVGSAVVRLAKRRGAVVTAVTAEDKAAWVRTMGADRVLDCDDDFVDRLAEAPVDVVVDNVSGPTLSALLDVLRRGGRYVCSGAIGGPLVSFDKRALYLRDLTLIGCTAWDEAVFPSLICAIERGEISPPAATAFPLARIADAQRAFLAKERVGKLVLIPPPPEVRRALGPSQRLPGNGVPRAWQVS